MKVIRRARASHLSEEASAESASTTAPSGLSRLGKILAGSVVGAAALAVGGGCTTTGHIVLTGAPQTVHPSTRVIDAGSRQSSLALRLGGTHVAPARADPGRFGAYSVMRTTAEVPCGTDAQGRAIATLADIYLPEGAGKFPAVIHCHGLISNKEQQQGTGAHYASHGVIVVVPNMPFGTDNVRENAPAVEKIADWVMSHPLVLGPQLDTSQGLALSGHSFGGLTVTMSARHPSVTAVVALDAAPQGTLGTDICAQLDKKVLYVMGQRELFNQGGSGKETLFDAIGSSQKQFIRVRRAHHTDFQNDRLTGPKNHANQQAMTFATSFVLGHFGDHRYEGFLGGAEYTNALQAGEIRRD